MNLISDDYLMHYGVKGMKWGVRHDRNPDGSLTRYGKKQKRKEISAYRKSQINQYESRKAKVKANAPDNSEQIKKLYKQVSDLATKYDFDQDDGGGGSTPASRKAGAQYMKLWDRIEYLEDQQSGRYTRSDHQRYVNNQLLKKYGEKTLTEAYDTKLHKLGAAYMNSGSSQKTWKPWMA